jgi:hypothetical protein
MWLAGLAAGAFVATELALGALALRNPLTYVVACLAGLAAVAALNRIQIRVDKDTLHVDDAHLPLWTIERVTIVEPAQRRELLGPEADPLAFVILRPWIGGGVRIDLADPDDPTPYWFVSSRRPHELATALSAHVRSA